MGFKAISGGGGGGVTQSYNCLYGAGRFSRAISWDRWSWTSEEAVSGGVAAIMLLAAYPGNIELTFESAIPAIHLRESSLFFSRA